MVCVGTLGARLGSQLEVGWICRLSPVSSVQQVFAGVILPCSLHASLLTSLPALAPEEWALRNSTDGELLHEKMTGRGVEGWERGPGSRIPAHAGLVGK